MRKATIRVVVAATALAMLAGACGGTPTQVAKGRAEVPAGTLLNSKQAKRYDPEVPDITSPTPTAPTQPTAAPSTRTPGPPGNPQASSLADPPLVGLYKHKIEVSGTGIPPGAGSLEFDVEVHEARSVAGGRQQVLEWRIEQFPQEFTYKWTPQELLLTRVESTQPNGSRVECDLEPPDITLKLPLETGSSWVSDSRCDGEGAEATRRVIRTEQVTVGSERIDTFVVESKSASTSEECGRSTTVETSWYAPSIRMFVRQESHTESRKCGEFDSVLDLLETAPRPAEG